MVVEGMVGCGNLSRPFPLLLSCCERLIIFGVVWRKERLSHVKTVQNFQNRRSKVDIFRGK